MNDENINDINEDIDFLSEWLEFKTISGKWINIKRESINAVEDIGSDSCRIFFCGGKSIEISEKYAHIMEKL